jgi:hypothetical protein
MQAKALVDSTRISLCNVRGRHHGCEHLLLICPDKSCSRHVGASLRQGRFSGPESHFGGEGSGSFTRSRTLEPSGRLKLVGLSLQEAQRIRRCPRCRAYWTNRFWQSDFIGTPFRQIVSERFYNQRQIVGFPCSEFMADVKTVPRPDSNPMTDRESPAAHCRPCLTPCTRNPFWQWKR